MRRQMPWHGGLRRVPVMVRGARLPLEGTRRRHLSSHGTCGLSRGTDSRGWARRAAARRSPTCSRLSNRSYTETRSRPMHRRTFSHRPADRGAAAQRRVRSRCCNCSWNMILSRRFRRAVRQGPVPRSRIMCAPGVPRRWRPHAKRPSSRSSG